MACTRTALPVFVLWLSTKMSVFKANCKTVGHWILLCNRIQLNFWSSVCTLVPHELCIWNVVFYFIINMPTVKYFGLSAVINMTHARKCQDAYGKFPVLIICIRWSGAYRQVTACCTVIINFTSFTSPSIINTGQKVCYFFSDLGVAVYLHA
jgi:hypothetical protein